jgi:hypothetical protein
LNYEKQQIDPTVVEIGITPEIVGVTDEPLNQMGRNGHQGDEHPSKSRVLTHSHIRMPE